jgi:hypothetical protein
LSEREDFQALLVPTAKKIATSITNRRIDASTKSPSWDDVTSGRERRTPLATLLISILVLFCRLTRRIDPPPNAGSTRMSGYVNFAQGDLSGLMLG